MSPKECSHDKARQDFSLRGLLLCVASKCAKLFTIRQASLGEIYGETWLCHNYEVYKHGSKEHRSRAAVYVCTLLLPSPLAVLSARAKNGVDNTADIFPWSRPKAWSTRAQTQVKCDLALLKEQGVLRGLWGRHVVRRYRWQRRMG